MRACFRPHARLARPSVYLTRRELLPRDAVLPALMTGKRKAAEREHIVIEVTNSAPVSSPRGVESLSRDQYLHWTIRTSSPLDRCAKPSWTTEQLVRHLTVIRRATRTRRVS